MIGMAGRLRLVIGLDGAGRCVVRDQFSSQLHRVLQLIPGAVPQEGLVYLLNPSGGIAQGDRLEAELRVGEGAHVILTAPSATKVYRMEEGEAVSRTRLHVSSGSVLEYLPEALIPHGGARFVEDLCLEVEEGGKALAWEMVAPGREARGESLVYERLALRLRVDEAGRPRLRERAEISPSKGVTGPIALGTYRHYGVLVAIGGDPRFVEESLRARAAEAESVFAGVTRLRGSGVMLKALATESRHLGGLFAVAREAVVPLLTGRPATPLRKT